MRTSSKQAYPFFLRKLDDSGLHLFIDFFREGRAFNALIDSGASCCFLEADKNADDSLLHDMQTAEMGSRFSSQSVWVNSLKIGNSILPNFLLSKVDLTAINASLVAMKQPFVKGILGSDALCRLNAEIDFEKEQLFLNHRSEMVSFLSPHEVSNIPFSVINIVVQGQECTMLVDTGASQTAFDNQTAEQLFPSDQYGWTENSTLSVGIAASDILLETTEFTVSFDKEKTLWNIIFRFLKMENINKAYQTLQIPAIHAIIGCDFLQNHKAIISFPEKKIYIE